MACLLGWVAGTRQGRLWIRSWRAETHRMPKPNRSETSLGAVLFGVLPSLVLTGWVLR